MKNRILHLSALPARLLLALALFFSCLSANVAQQYPLTVNTTLVPPYPVRFEDYLDLGDKVIVTVMNHTAQPRTFNFSISIQGPNNLTIQRSPLFKQPFTVGPNQVKSLTASDWDFSNMLLSTNDIQPPAERQYLIQNRVLREGNYTVCLQAIDAQTGQPLSAATGSNCASYTANYGAPPVIVAPANNQVLPFFTPLNLHITWVQYNLLDPAKVRYRVKIIDLTANNITDPSQATVAMNNPGVPAFYEKDGITGYAHLVSGEPFKEGHVYALRVTSYDPQNQTIFQNGGHSDVVTFQFSKNISACANPGTFVAVPHYPLAGDTIPFTRLPMVVRFAPECELYNKFEYRLELDKKLQRKEAVPWPQGALKFVQAKYNKTNLTWPFAAHQSLGNPKKTLERGKQYRWDARLTVWNAQGQKWQSVVRNVPFTVGMPVPRQQYPAVTGKVTTGKATFRWRARTSNKALLPAVALKAFDSNGVPQAVAFGPMKERWVLQVFRGYTTDTARIVFQKDSLITLDPAKYLNSQTLTYDTARFRQDFERIVATVVKINTPGTYYWRVGWARNPDQTGQNHKYTDAELYHASKLREVIFVSTGTQDDCVAACDAPTITDRTAAPGLKAKDKLKIGQFELVVTSVEAKPGNAFSGEGYIPVRFLKDWPIKVKFENIKKNKAGQIFEGKVTVVKDKDFLDPSYVVQAGDAIGLSKDLSKSLATFLNQGGRLINSGVRKNQPIGLPIGIDNKIEGNTIVVAILDMKFTPQRATLTAVVNLDIPALNPYRANFISMGVKDLCFGPQGTASEGVALLPRDIVIDVDDPTQVPKEAERTQIVIKSSINASDPQKRTEVAWSCKGFKHVNLAIEVRFSRKTIVPDGPQGKPGKGRVTASAYLRGTRGLNFIGQLQMRDFQIPVKAMEGYAFKVKDAWIDLSSVENPPDLASNLPKNYNSPDLKNPDKKAQALWRGFWLKELSVKIPQYIGNVNNEAERNTQISAHNVIIDRTGFTAAFLVEGLIKWESKNNKPKHIDGVRFSLDSMWVQVQQNSLTQAGLSGKLGIPFADRHDYLKYRGVLDHKTQATNFRFAVSVTDSLKIPMFFAEAKLDKNSNIEFSVGDHSYVAFDINATINIKEDSLKLDIPGIRLEHLNYHSTNGFDNKKFRFGLASPQKWFANFPLSFDKFNITAGNAPVVSWEMTLAFQGELPKKKDKKKKGKWGLSGTVGMAIHTKLGKGEGLWDQIKGFEVKEVRLNKIALDAEVASVKIKGTVEFYKENNLDGFRGELNVELPANIKAGLEGEFGTYKKPGAKTFDTPDWYSYWRIAGVVVLGDAGVPLFAGLNLYGIGGGVYHHMTRTAELPSLVAAKTASKSKEKKSAYKPDYNTQFGLLFSVLMGSPGGGKAFNFGAKLEASFTRAGGLNYLGITGEMKAMCEGLNDNSPEVGGWVKIEYHKAEEEFVQGRLFVTVNAGVIKGNAKIPDPPKDYKGDKEHAYIWAEFYADVSGKKDFWYLNMGTPQNRGSLAVTFDPNKKTKVKKDKKKKEEDKKIKDPFKIDIKFTAYLMIGHKVPSVLPPPDAAFMKIWAMAGGGKNDFSGGKVSEFVKGKKRPPLPPGQGFAFGASFSLDLQANPVPFYFDMGLVFGFDINVTRNEQRRCFIPSKGEITPGIDYWYALGQMYAGAYADFGLKVELWFINGKFSIFQGAAAMVLRGGFPNPNWAEGRGRLAFSILGGLFKGNCAFDVAVGEKCDPTVPLNQLLDQMEFIQDLKPADKDEEVDVFTALTATFAVPINRVMEIPEKDSTIRRIVPVISTWTLKDKNGKLVPVEDIYFTNDNLAATLNPKVVLAGNTRYTTYIEVKARELLGGGRWVYVQKKGKDWYQSKTHTFTTGKAPDVIPDRNVLFTWPLANQRYFLKGETEGGKWGYIVLDKGMTYLFRDRAKYDYIVRFTRLDGSGHTLDVTLFPEEHDRVLKFNVARLENGKYYALQVLEVDKALKQKLQQQASLAGTAVAFNAPGGLQQLNTMPLAQTLQLREESVNLLKGQGSVLTSDVIKKRELPGTTVRHPAERVLYNFYFGTSKYNTFKAKLAGRAWQHSQATFAFIVPGYLSQATLDEPFEQYDKQGYTHNGYQVEPLLELFLNGYNGRYTKAGLPTNTYVKRRLEDGFLSTVRAINGELKYKQIPFRLVPRQPAMDNFVTFNNLSTWASPLSRAELDAANNPTPGSQMASLGGGLTGASGGFITGLQFGGGTAGGGSMVFQYQPPTPKLAIGYHPVMGGTMYLHDTRQKMSNLLGWYLDFPCIDDVKAGRVQWPSSSHWWYRYFKRPKRMAVSGSGGTVILENDYLTAWNKYLRNAQKCLSGPTLQQFLDKWPPLKMYVSQLLQTPMSSVYMSTSPPQPHSFVLQYRYPSTQSRLNTSHKKVASKMAEGTWSRIVIKP